ncbi:unnamed protein product [Brassica rapa]|uniref:Uncharacterized protein n=1 Tax=Brassica campestris TaxID=3711 RepID=A0A8D9M699_BRACM|nr:unnamed protein product [Brassica rapa]
MESVILNTNSVDGHDTLVLYYYVLYFSDCSGWINWKLLFDLHMYLTLQVSMGSNPQHMLAIVSKDKSA